MIKSGSMDAIKESFLLYLSKARLLGNDRQSLLDDLELINTPEHNLILFWGESVLDRTV